MRGSILLLPFVFWVMIFNTTIVLMALNCINGEWKPEVIVKKRRKGS